MTHGAGAAYVRRGRRNATYGCTVGPFCGDGNVNGPEECDDGVNQTTYGQTKGCGPGCRTVPYCGDGNVDSLFGEECDDGPANSDTAYGGCATNCQIGPHCGDGIVNGTRRVARPDRSERFRKDHLLQRADWFVPFGIRQSGLRRS